MTDERVIVTCIQEKWDNATMVVRLNGKVLGRLLQDSKNGWIVRPPDPSPQIYSSLEAAVNALVNEELANR